MPGPTVPWAGGEGGLRNNTSVPACPAGAERVAGLGAKIWAASPFLQSRTALRRAAVASKPWMWWCWVDLLLAFPPRHRTAQGAGPLGRMLHELHERILHRSKAVSLPHTLLAPAREAHGGGEERGPATRLRGGSGSTDRSRALGLGLEPEGCAARMEEEKRRGAELRDGSACMAAEHPAGAACPSSLGGSRRLRFIPGERLGMPASPPPCTDPARSPCGI